LLQLPAPRVSGFRAKGQIIIAPSPAPTILVCKVVVVAPAPPPFAFAEKQISTNELVKKSFTLFISIRIEVIEIRIKFEND